MSPLFQSLRLLSIRLSSLLPSPLSLHYFQKYQACSLLNHGLFLCSPVVVNLPQRENIGKARDLAANKLGISGSSAERAEKVVKKIDELKADGETEKAETLRELLNEKSVNAAYQEEAMLFPLLL